MHPDVKEIYLREDIMACLEIEEQASLFFTSLISSSPDEVYFTIDCSKSYENLLSQIYTDFHGYFLSVPIRGRKKREWDKHSNKTDADDEFKSPQALLQY
jgi:hypothetical protein